MDINIPMLEMLERVRYIIDRPTIQDVIAIAAIKCEAVADTDYDALAKDIYLKYMDGIEMPMYVYRFCQNILHGKIDLKTPEVPASKQQSESA